MLFNPLLVVVLTAFSFSLVYAQETTDEQTLLSLFASPENAINALNQQIEQKISEELAKISPLKQLSSGIPLYEIACKQNLIIVLKSYDNSPACIKPESLSKLIERNWIKEAYAQEITMSEPSVMSQYFPPDDQRALVFGVTITGTPLEKEEGQIRYGAFKFTHLPPFHAPEEGKLPNNLQASPIQFTLESVPSLDKRSFYHLLNGYIRSEGPFTGTFNVQIDVVTGNGSVIQTWEYGSCKPVLYRTFLQDSLVRYQFSGKFESEIREEAGFNCSFYTIRAGDIDQRFLLPTQE